MRIAVIIADAELALKQSDHKRSLAVTDNLLADLRQWGMQSQIPRALYLQGRALLGLGQDKTARKRLLEARTIAEEIGSRRILWQVLTLLAQIAQAHGQDEKARQLWAQAREIVEFMADNISDPELRALFLNAKPVHTMLQQTN
ncbi:MAG: hypothetical protein GY832_24505 [Chloroflexi bacterium]|nr:hypothetical protein [Chloroflexota bacterium]